MTTTESSVSGEAGGHHHEYKIIVNGRERTATTDVLSFEDVVALAFNPVPTDKDFTVVYHDAEQPKKHGSLDPGETVTIKNGTKFDVTATNKS